jgi:hypothetical protein
MASRDKQRNSSTAIVGSLESDSSTSRAYYVRSSSSRTTSHQQGSSSLAQPFPKPKAPLPTIIMHKVGPGVSLDQAKESIAVHKRKVVGVVGHLHRKKEELKALEKEGKDKDRDTKRRRKG